MVISVRFRGGVTRPLVAFPHREFVVSSVLAAAPLPAGPYRVSAMTFSVNFTKPNISAKLAISTKNMSSVSAMEFPLFEQPPSTEGRLSL